jgi:Tol biopolymer transport system component
MFPKVLQNACPARNCTASVRAAVAMALTLAVSIPLATASPAAAGERGRGRIVWTNAPDNTFSEGHLVSARPDGRGFRELTPATPGVNDIDASTSPDGRHVVYERVLADSSGLRIIKADGRHDHPLNLACTDPCVGNDSPTWLTNGRIAFTHVLQPFDGINDSPHSAVLFTAKPDGSDVRRLSEPGIDGAYEDAYARLAPGGHYVVFARHRDLDGMTALFRMALDGSHVRQLIPYGPAGAFFDISPARSGPTKDLVVFDTFTAGQTSLDVATVPAGCTSLADCTGRIRFLTHNFDGPGRNGNPAWSPDGRRIAFTDRASIDDQNADILTMRYDATHRRQVSTSPLFDYRPDWGHSG